MDLLYTIVVTLITLGILVTIHEYGHFWVARRCGVKVLRFSVGFGPQLFTWTGRDGTEYCLSAVPLGGYVKMLDEREGDVAPEQLPFAFNTQPVLSRIAIVSAGPIANFILAIVAYYMIFLTGVTGVVPIIGSVEKNSIADRAGLEAGQEIVKIDGEETPTWQQLNLQLLNRLGESGAITFSVKYPNFDNTYDNQAHEDQVYESRAVLDKWLINSEAADLVKEIGITPYRPKLEAIIDEVVAGSPAARAGLRTGDRIVETDGITITDWEQWVGIIHGKARQTVSITVVRDAVPLTLQVTPDSKPGANGETIGQVGVAVKTPVWPEGMLRTYQYSVLTAWLPALQRTAQISLFTLDSMKKMLFGLISPKNLSGPITIAKVASDYASEGFEAYIGFLALLSISLGVLNLLPIPVLDGGHLLFYFIELIKGSPVPEKVQMLGYQLGFFIIISVMLLALYNDISRL